MPYADHRTGRETVEVKAVPTSRFLASLLEVVLRLMNDPDQALLENAGTGELVKLDRATIENHPSTGDLPSQTDSESSAVPCQCLAC